MKQINVGLGARSYPIVIDRGLLDPLFFFNNRADGIPGSADLVRGFEAGVCVVTDETVNQLYGARFLAAFEQAGVQAAPVVIAPGEESKNLSVFGALMDLFAAAGLSRKSLVLALGGGVVGDLAGFAAASWMRGVRYVQIPTTLLAMVDSSVGGKTAIDIPAGKNLVGAFHQPSFVAIDPDLLKTLPAREFKSGMAEVIKYGAIASPDLFEKLEHMAAAGKGTDDPALDDVIAACIGIKADIVSEDELDTGRRQILNFGHTFGHALEVHYGFSKYTHGEGVGMGMRIAARYGEAVGVTEAGTAQRLCTLLNAFGLGEEANLGVGVGASDLIAHIRNDKKASAGKVDLVLLKRLGEALVLPVSLAELEADLRKLSV
jgi:3-dehydroquinate synthase